MDDIEQTYSIIAKRSICISGLTTTDTDSDIRASLQPYGVVAKIVRLSSTEREDDSTVIVEFTSETPMTVLELSLPFEISNPNDTTVTWYVDSLKVLTLDTRHTQARPQGNSSNSSSSSESSDDSAHSEHSTSPLIRSSKGRKTDLVKPIPFQLSPVKDKKAQTPDKTKVQPAVRRKTIKAKTLLRSPQSIFKAVGFCLWCRRGRR